MLGHLDDGAAKDHYEGKLPEVAVAAMKMLEAKATAKKMTENGLMVKDRMDRARTFLKEANGRNRLRGFSESHATHSERC